MTQFTARPGPTSSVAVLPTVSFEHSAKETNERILFDPRVRETLYESLPLRGRPLSYTEMLRRWMKAVVKRRYAVYSMEEAQEEYEDCASDIIAIVGRDEYNKFLEKLLGAIEQWATTSAANIQGRVDF